VAKHCSFGTKRAAFTTAERTLRRAAYKFGTGKRRKQMLYWALVFLVIAIVAGVLGFGGIAAASAGIAKILFVVFLVLFLIGLVMHFGRRGSAV
jgi:uncharacterized membrane protein YtjA (UPF0391 family)